MVQYYNHPSIVMWVVMNEGWGIGSGQAEIDRLNRMVDTVRKRDLTRIINDQSGDLNGFTSGTHDDVRDAHPYPAPTSLSCNTTYIMQLGEFGGIHLDMTPYPTHKWKSPDYAANCDWGYANASTQTEWGNMFKGYCQSIANYKASTARN